MTRVCLLTNEVEQHFVFMVPQPCSLDVMAFVSQHIPYSSLIYHVVLLGKLTFHLRCSFEEPAVFQACLCSQKKQIQRAEKRRQGSSFSFGMDPQLPLTLNLRKMEAREGWLAVLMLHVQPPSTHSLPCPVPVLYGPHNCSSASYFQAGLAGDRHHHERRQEYKDEGSFPSLPVWVPRAAITNYHRLGWLNNRNLFCHSSGGWKSKIKVRQVPTGGSEGQPVLCFWWSGNLWYPPACRPITPISASIFT